MGEVVDLVKALEEIDADLIVESQPGTVKIRVYGTKDEVRETIQKILALTKRKARPRASR